MPKLSMLSKLKKPAGELKVIIAGAGAAGIYAREILMREGVLPKNITLLEKESRIGGKCNTFYHPDNKKLKSDYGAHWVAPNYGSVIQEIKRHKVTTESVVPNHKTGIPFFDTFSKKSLIEKIKMIPPIAVHFLRYVYHVMRYQKLTHTLSTELPSDYYLPFSEYAKKHNMTHMIDLFKPAVSGFGYGPMETLPTHLLFNYLEKSIPLAMLIDAVHVGYPILGIQGGFQHLMETIAAKHPIITSANITEIERNPDCVKVNYSVDGIAHTVQADGLILAMPPLQWQRLGMKLTPLEEECIKELEISRYPVAIVEIEGMDPAELYFFNKALQLENFAENHGEIALVTTSHQGSGTRLCTVFQNLPRRRSDAPPVNEEKERELFIEKIVALADKQGWKIKQIHDIKVWTDYMPYLPPRLSYALERAQMDDQRTLRCTSVLPGSFEDVEQAFRTAERCVMQYIFDKEYKAPGNWVTGLVFNLFSRPAALYNRVNPNAKAAESEIAIPIKPKL